MSVEKKRACLSVCFDTGSVCVCTFVSSSFAKQSAEALQRHLNAVVEHVVLLLEPSDPVLRKSSLKYVTKTLIMLCEEYPMLCFDQLTQRLVLGSGRDIIAYDLRTATKWRVLQGHVSTVSAVAVLSTSQQFAIASYSATERAVLAWNFNNGFFGSFLRTQGSVEKRVTLPMVSALSGTSLLQTCALTWVSPKAVRLRREDGGIIGMIKLL